MAVYLVFFDKKTYQIGKTLFTDLEKDGLIQKSKQNHCTATIFGNSDFVVISQKPSDFL